VWISRSYNSERPLEYGVHSAICLHGFDANQPIALRVKGGNVEASTTVVPTTGEPNVDGYLLPSTLFEDGQELPVYPAGADLLISQMWMFVTTAAARDQFARGEKLFLTAIQAGRKAITQQDVATPTLPGRIRIDGLPEGQTRLLILGFRQDKVVPVGLYRLSNTDESAGLVARLGSVRMPRARAAEFEVSATVLKSRPAGEYCVTVPLQKQINCPFVG
jgi:hypothetical protein